MTEISSRDYYRRQLQLPELGVKGQERLSASRILIIGMGALGSPAAVYLAGAGVGTLLMMDDDRIEISNLHRQPLYTAADAGKLKVHQAAKRLAAYNPLIRITPIAKRFCADPQDMAVLQNVDCVLDCSDRFSSRFCLHDACYAAKKTLVSSAVQGFSGQLHLFDFTAEEKIPCLRCLWPRQPEDGCTGSCASDGIIGAAAGILGSYQAMSVLEYLAGIETIKTGFSYLFDLKTMNMSRTEWERNPDCILCGNSGGDLPEPLPDRPVTAESCLPLSGLPDESAVSAHVNHKEQIEKPRILDIRELDEILPSDRIALPAAEHIPLSIVMESLKDWDKKASYLIICEHGIRSRELMRFMKKMGFKKLSHIEGGYSALRNMVVNS
ncbi:MAG: ThiF family adenylyltransferase [Spirochaetales bacterium]|nr:ThiF family adenylyltransferase [Spirochaetales bacterium]